MCGHISVIAGFDRPDLRSEPSAFQGGSDAVERRNAVRVAF